MQEKSQIPIICECRKGSGVSCIHQIQQYYDSEGPLPLALFYPYWRLQILQPSQFHPDLVYMQELCIRTRAGLSRGGTGSQERIPSLFEVIDSQEDTADNQLQISFSQQENGQKNERKGGRLQRCSNCRRLSYHNINGCEELLYSYLI